MRITRLVLSDVRRHERLDVSPAPGLTVVRGPNEAGKSTLHEALELVLFRKADTNREDVRSIHRWGAEAHPRIVLEFEIDGQPGRLVKRFAGPRAEAELTFGGQTISDFASIQEEVAALTGIPNETFFRATASVGHAELSALNGVEATVSDRLQKAVSGADRGTARARRKLEAAIHRYRTEGHKNPGLLKAAREEITHLETELATGEAALARLEADRAQWAEAHLRREELDVQLARQQADLNGARRAEMLALQRDEAQASYDRLKRATELVEEAEALRRELPTSLPLATLRSAVGRATTLGYEVPELEAELDVLSDVTLAGEVPDRPPHPARWLVLAVALLTAGALAGSLLEGILGALALVVCMLLALVMLAQGYRVAARRRQHLLAQGLARDSAARRREVQRDHEERFRRRRRELELVLEELGVANVAAAEAMLAAMEQHTDRLAHIEGELRGLGVQERSARRLAEARDQAAADTEQARHALAGMFELGRDPAASRQAAQRLVEQTLPARDRARSEEDQAQGRVDANLVDAELVAELAERLAVARDRLGELLRRVTIYEATLQAIEAAEQATLKTAARYLEEHMGPAMERLTEGRYREVRVDDQSLAFMVRAPETGALVDVGQLSQGTSDQLFLAARLGLVRLVTMDRRPPLILDDPFVTFDEERARRAVGLLRSIALEQGFQVLLLTCSDRFDALADAVIVLEGPAVLPPPGVNAGHPNELEAGEPGPRELPASEPGAHRPEAGASRPTELPASEPGGSRPTQSEPRPGSAGEPAAEGLWGVLSSAPADVANGGVEPIGQADDRSRGSQG